MRECALQTLKPSWGCFFEGGGVSKEIMYFKAMLKVYVPLISGSRRLKNLQVQVKGTLRFPIALNLHAPQAQTPEPDTRKLSCSTRAFNHQQTRFRISQNAPVSDAPLVPEPQHSLNPSSSGIRRRRRRITRIIV